jgi:hypothetical protein
MGTISYSCHWKKEKVKIADGFSCTIDDIITTNSKKLSASL